jgi:zinc transporter 1/2/3
MPGIGWILSTQGDLVTSIFQAISAGTFLYIATLEVLVHEFSTVRHIGAKYALYLVSIGFVSSIWYLEQITGG